MSDIAENLEEVKSKIAAAAGRGGHDPAKVRLVAVSKTFPAEAVGEAFKAGQTLFGENRVQEAKDKIPHVPAGTEWHMIGRLQKNKAKYIPGLFDMVHSVDSFELAEALNYAMGRALQKGMLLPYNRLDVLIQVNIAMEAQKGGLELTELAETIRRIAPMEHLFVRGLMIIPPYAENPEDSRGYYQKLRELRDSLSAENIPNIEMKELSMGMSGDYEVAVEEGATLVRVGSAIFGARDHT